MQLQHKFSGQQAGDFLERALITYLLRNAPLRTLMWYLPREQHQPAHLAPVSIVMHDLRQHFQTQVQKPVQQVVHCSAAHCM